MRPRGFTRLRSERLRRLAAAHRALIRAERRLAALRLAEKIADWREVGGNTPTAAPPGGRDPRGPVGSLAAARADVERLRELKEALVAAAVGKRR